MPKIKLTGVSFFIATFENEIFFLQVASNTLKIYVRQI